MKSILLGKELPLETVTNQLKFPCLEVSVSFEYDNDGKRTDKIIGHVYTIGDMETFSQMKVTVGGRKPLFTNEQLQAERVNGHIFVEFEDAYIKQYFNYRTNSVADSIKAVGIKLAEDN